MWRVGIIACVFAVSLKSDLYEANVMKPVIYATTAIAKITSEDSRDTGASFGGFTFWGSTVKVGDSNQVLMDNSLPYFQGLDIVFESVNIFTSAMMQAIDTFRMPKAKTDKDDPLADKKTSEYNDGLNMSQLLTVGVIGTILTGSVMVYVTGGMLLLLNHVFLIVMLTLGPMFLCMAAFKTTREYAKKWAVKLLTVALTLSLVMSVLGFVLNMQSSVSSGLCSVALSLQTQMSKNLENGLGSLTAEQKQLLEKNSLAIINIVKARLDNLEDNLAGSENKTLAKDIKSGCFSALGVPTSKFGSGMSIEASDIPKKSGGGSNLLFVSMQYLVLCMIFSRLITEMANLASAIIGASGMNGSASEVSGSVQGTMNRGVAKNSQGGKGSNIANKPNSAQ